MTESEAYQILGQFPHCDQRVLHAPGNCEHCDKHPDWQAYRISLRINFTGESKEGYLPCPSEVPRTFQAINRWPGNRATNPKPEVAAPPPFESLKEE